MRKLAILTAAAALAAALGYGGAAHAESFFPFDGDLAGYWHFDTNAGTADAEDGTLNNNDGDLQNGATRSTDIPDLPNNTNSVSLDGSDDLVSIGNPSELQITGDLTLSACIKTNDLANGQVAAIVGKWAIAIAGDSYALSLFKQSGVIKLASGIGDGSTADPGLLGGSITAGQWTHVATTYDADDGTHKIFIDGTEVASRDRDGGVHDSSSDVLIGQQDNAASPRPFDGLIDDARIYDVTLSADQIDQMQACDFPTDASLEKEITSGPDEDGDSEIDVVVPVGEPTELPDPYDFTITYTAGTDDPFAIVFDTVPAEWAVTGPPGPNDPEQSFGTTETTEPAGGNPNKSATKIEWDVEDVAVGTLLVDVLNRQSPSGKSRFKPTECGPIFPNDGAVALKSDGDDNLVLVGGVPIVLAGPTDAICLAAVENPGIASGDRSATADHDTDTLASFGEACVNVVRTDPCLADTDGDTVKDDTDNCPLIVNAGQEDADGDGVGTACDPDDTDDTVNVVAQCADGIDNDGDGRIDHSSSALSNQGGDTLCSSATDNDESS